MSKISALVGAAIAPAENDPAIARATRPFIDFLIFTILFSLNIYSCSISRALNGL
jgi:hypothetical protein